MLNLNFSKIFFAFCLATVFSACTKDDNFRPSDCNFLKTGNIWTYDRTENFIHRVFRRQITAEADSVFKITETIVGNAADTVYWFSEGGYLCAYKHGESKTDGRRIYKCNAQVGETWQSPDFLNRGLDIYLVLRNGVEINTFSGVFICSEIRIRHDYDIDVEYTYWSPVYGEVMRTGLVGLELTSTNL